ncbi:roadblock/LC7 domain-containing protein [Candidatus Methylocalor cossyra]|uniref:Roadblock/LC7 family protein n=1 Tax=Candidatus Methylocalor cossyra TaxID=3108543 RepID=A0ABP1C6X8_9GAMM
MAQTAWVSILEQLNEGLAEVEASALVSQDGLALAMAARQPVDEDRIGALTAAVLSAGGRAANELRHGPVEQIIIKGRGGHILVVGSEKPAFLAVSAKPAAEIDAILPRAQRAMDNLCQLL